MPKIQLECGHDRFVSVIKLHRMCDVCGTKQRVVAVNSASGFISIDEALAIEAVKHPPKPSVDTAEVMQRIGAKKPPGTSAILRVVEDNPRLTEMEIKRLAFPMMIERDLTERERRTLLGQAFWRLLKRHEIEKLSLSQRPGQRPVYVLGERSELRLAERTLREDRPVRSAVPKSPVRE